MNTSASPISSKTSISSLDGRCRHSSDRTTRTRYPPPCARFRLPTPYTSQPPCRVYREYYQETAASYAVHHQPTEAHVLSRKLRKAWSTNQETRFARMGKHRSVSMMDVARHAGVSAQTVSRVANGSDAVRPEMRERVQRSMDALGYRPNSAARMLKRGRFGSIGLVMFRVAGTGNLATLEGLSKAALEHCYALTLTEMPRDRDQSLEEAARIMSNLPVDAAIINVNYRTPDFETFSPHPNLKTVIIAPAAQPNCTTVGIDQRAAAREVTEHLLGLGHRTVHFISGPTASIPNRLRCRGWMETLADHGAPCPKPTMGNGDWTADSGYIAGQQLARDPSCTAIYAANDALAYGAIEALRSAGKRVPEDVSVAGTDDSYDGVVPSNKLTSIRFDNHMKGRIAFQEALGADSIKEPHQVVVPAHLVVRGTTGPAPHR